MRNLESFHHSHLLRVLGSGGGGLNLGRSGAVMPEGAPWRAVSGGQQQAGNIARPRSKVRSQSGRRATTEALWDSGPH